MLVPAGVAVRFSGSCRSHMSVDDESPEHLAVASLDPLTADELVDDRALARVEEDAFGLRDFVDELAARCRVIATPANIALYGAWGSGKTSLGNLLQAKFKDDKRVAFGRFDAFKFAEVPLRRHFLASVAASFNVSDEKYSRDLYRTKKDQNLRIPPKKAVEVAGLVAVATLALTALMAIAAAVVALISIRTASFGSTFVEMLKASAPGIVIAAPIVAVLLAAALRRFEVETTTSAPFSDEEFERLFLDLVVDIKSKKQERVVIFIDELDRCSPKQVGSVLETLRTFLDVESCVFIVAADQQVLEHALMEGGSRQATPHDRANPYYSSGSAYLDKIFHHQIPLPPLLPRRLSRFAFELIDKRPGVWQRVPNRAELVSVLVPTHVRSPRRVKALLNTFSSLLPARDPPGSRGQARRRGRGSRLRDREARLPPNRVPALCARPRPRCASPGTRSSTARRAGRDFPRCHDDRALQGYVRPCKGLRVRAASRR